MTIISRRYRFIIITTAFLFGAVYFGLSAYMAMTLTRTDRKEITITPERLGLIYENISFSSDGDSILVKGWFIPASGSNRIIIMVHGRAYHRANPEIGLLDIAASLNKNGFNILMFDMRGWGESDGKRFSLGYWEQRDVKGAINYAKSRGFSADRIGIIGWSMGAASAMLAVDNTHRVKAMVEDSGYAVLRELLKVQVPQKSGLPAFFTFGIVNMVRLMYGVDLYSLRPAEAAAAMKNSRIFVIHGESDSLVPVEHARRIFAAKNGEEGNEVWLVPGVDHTKAYKSFPQEYIDRITAFFDRELR